MVKRKWIILRRAYKSPIDGQTKMGHFAAKPQNDPFSFESPQYGPKLSGGCRPKKPKLRLPGQKK
jgi:hypothetical protein